MTDPIRTPASSLPEEPADQSHSAGDPEVRLAGDGALFDPRAATRWASSPLLRGTSPLTVDRRWNDLQGTRTRR